MKQQSSSHPHEHLTKIVATLATGDKVDAAFIQKLFERGMDVARLNTAHMAFDQLHDMVTKIRQVSPAIAILLDTKGPNIRTCNIPADGMPLTAGQTVKISGIPADDGRVCVNYASFVEEVPVGSAIVCDDGAVKFKVVGKKEDYLVAEVLFDTLLKDKKSINVPDVSIKAPALTDKDREFLRLAAEEQCDFIAHSFVRNADDILEVRRALGEKGKEIKIIAKIENREGVTNIQEILKEADGLMVARGDLGIEIPLEEVPAIQKMLIYEARKMAKPVIVATQMLQSMITNPAPTRAEVSDVANAVYDGTDAVMLSGETSSGAYPCEAVETMKRIVVEAEHAPRAFFTELPTAAFELDSTSFLLGAAIKSMELLPVKLVVCSTLSGRSARFCSALRPALPILAPTPNPTTCRQLALSYGVHSMLIDFSNTSEGQADLAISCIKNSHKNLKDDDLIVILGKVHNESPNNNVLYIATRQEIIRPQEE